MTDRSEVTRVDDLAGELLHQGHERNSRRTA